MFSPETELLGSMPEVSQGGVELVAVVVERDPAPSTSMN